MSIMYDIMLEELSKLYEIDVQAFENQERTDRANLHSEKQVTIKEIKQLFSLCSSAEEYASFALSHCDDERSGIKNLVKRAVRTAKKISSEKERVHALYQQERTIANNKICMGMDEVGRGPLAGPLTIGAVVLNYDIPEIQGINDSKQLSANKREELSEQIKQSALAYAIIHIEPSFIDDNGMSKALRTAFGKAIEEIDRQLMDRIGTKPEIILLDGNPLHLDQRETNVIKGDATCASISCASIIAKVERDAIMSELAKTYPNYGWEGNAGYGSPSHIEAIKKFGLTPVHRSSFCKNFIS